MVESKGYSERSRRSVGDTVVGQGAATRGLSRAVRAVV